MDDTQFLECTQALPDDLDDSDSTEKEPDIVSWLEISGTRHDVYSGETKIGRDPTACKIVLESKALSKQHAVIEAEGDVHTLADLGSMNKTRLGRMVLRPHVRYALHGGERLRFGDVSALYIMKPVNQDVDSGSETESESMLPQNNSEERLSSPFLSHHLPDFIPETPQSVRTAPENGMDTIIPESPCVSESPALSESTTVPKKRDRKVSFESTGNLSCIKAQKQDESKDGSFFFDPSQPKTPSLSLSSKTSKPDDSGSDNYNSDVSTDNEDNGDEPTQIFDGNVTPSITEHTIKARLGTENKVANEDVPVQIFDDTCTATPSGRKECPVNEGLHVERTIASDEEETRLSTGGRKVGKGESELGFSSVANDEEEKGWSSDASTDIEDMFDQPDSKTSSAKNCRQSKSNLDDTSSTANLSSEDCTQDIMAAFGYKGKNKTSDGLDNIDMSVPTQPFSALEITPVKVAGKVDFEAATQVFSGSEKEWEFRKPLATAPKLKRKSRGLSASLDVDFMDVPTQVFPPDAPTQPFNEAPRSDFLDAPTQPLCLDSDDEKSNQVTSAKKDKALKTGSDAKSPQGKDLEKTFSDSDDDVDDIFNQPTQPFSTSSAVVNSSSDTAKKITKKKDEDSDSDNDIDIFNQPTQPFHADTAVRSKTTPLKKTSCTANELSDSDDDVTDVFNQPTQVFSLNEKDSIDFNAPTQVLNPEGLIQTDSSFKSADVDLDAPTQVLDCVSLATSKNGGRKCRLKDSRYSSTNTSNEHDDDKNLPPTQVFNITSSPQPGTSTSSENPSEGIADSLAPTQPFVKGAVVDINETCVSEPAILRDTHSLSESDYDAPTQVFDAPTQLFSDVAKNISSSPSEAESTSKGSSTSIVQLWGGLDKGATQELDLQAHVNDATQIDDDATQELDLQVNIEIDDSVSPIKKSVPITGLEGHDKAADQSDSASDASETLLSERQFEEEYSTRVFEEGGNKALCMNSDVSTTKLPRNDDNEKLVCKAKEKDFYNSDVITDVEDAVPVLSKISKELKISESSLKNNTSHPDQSCDSGIDGSKESPSLPDEQVKNSTALGNKQEQEEDSNDKSKKKMTFKRVSKINPVIASTPGSKITAVSQGSPDSPALTDSDTNLDFDLSDIEESEESAKRKSPRKVGKASGLNQLLSSDSDTDLDVSQRLFDMSPSCTKSMKTQMRVRQEDPGRSAGRSEIMENESVSKNRPKGKQSPQNAKKKEEIKVPAREENVKKSPRSGRKNQSLSEEVRKSPRSRRNNQNISEELLDSLQGKKGPSSKSVVSPFPSSSKNFTIKSRSKRRIDYRGSSDSSSERNANFSGFASSPAKDVRSETDSEGEQSLGRSKKGEEACQSPGTSEIPATRRSTRMFVEENTAVKAIAQKLPNQSPNKGTSKVVKDSPKVLPKDATRSKTQTNAKDGSDRSEPNALTNMPVVEQGRRERSKFGVEKESNLQPSSSPQSSSESVGISLLQQNRRGRRTDVEKESAISDIVEESVLSLQPDSESATTSALQQDRKGRKNIINIEKSRVSNIEQASVSSVHVSSAPVSSPSLRRRGRSKFDMEKESDQQSSSSTQPCLESFGTSSLQQNKKGRRRDAEKECAISKIVKESVLSLQPSSESATTSSVQEDRRGRKSNTGIEKCRVSNTEKENNVSSLQVSSGPVPSSSLQQGRRGRKRNTDTERGIPSDTEVNVPSSQPSTVPATSFQHGRRGRKNKTEIDESLVLDREIESSQSFVSLASSVKDKQRRLNKLRTVSSNTGDICGGERAEEQDLNIETTVVTSKAKKVARESRQKQPKVDVINIEAKSVEEVIDVPEGQGMDGKEAENKAEKKKECLGVQNKIGGRRRSKEPDRYSPDRAVKTKKTRGQKSSNSEIKQEPVDAVSGKKGRKSVKGDQGETVAGPGRVSTRHRGSTDISTDEEAVSINANMSVKACEEPEVNPSRSRGREKMLLFQSDTVQQPESAQSKRMRTSIASVQQEWRTEKPSRRNRASIASDKVEPLIIKRARLGVIQETTNTDILDASENPKRQTRKQRGKKASQTESASKGKDTIEQKSIHVTEIPPKRLCNSKTSQQSSEEMDSSKTLSQSTDESSVLQKSRKRQFNDTLCESEPGTPKTFRRERSRRGSPLPEEQLCSPSQRQQRANNKPKVLFTGYKDPKDEKIVTDLGGWLVDSPRACSVLVTTRVCRTFKLLSVMGRGIPIVSPAWLTACRTARCFVDPWQFLVEDHHAEEEFGFNLEQSLQSAGKFPLFEGLAIHATSSVKPPPSQMKEIIECSGGQYMDSSPKKYGPQIMIVSCPEDKALWSSFKSLGIPVLGTEFILTGLLRHELLLDEFIL